MKRKKLRSKMWVHFSLVVFSIMLGTAAIMIGVVFLLFRFGVLHSLLNKPDGTPFISIAFLLLLSVIIGTVISTIVARRILNPITKFSKAAAKVAKGDFQVRMSEQQRIDELSELAHHFNTMVRELGSIETLRNDFVVNVSHEFKTPIAAIEGYATLLTDINLPATERNEYAKMIIESARQLSTLIRNILSLSKLENQDMILEKKPFRLDEQIRQAVLMLESKWSAKELDLQIDLDRTVYTGNEDLLMQVWLNIIGNAVKFTPPGGIVGIRLTRDDKDVVVEVRDTGCGMDETVTAHIFNKFYQGDTARKADGYGLGLSLAKRIIELSGGNIAVKSKVGEGTAFTVSLPA